MHTILAGTGLVLALLGFAVSVAFWIPKLCNRARLKEILAGRERAPKYAHLTAGARQAVLEILRDTKTNLPDGF